jgi:hypothetical protein
MGRFILVRFVWYPGGFLYLNRQTFSRFGIFKNYFIECIIKAFCLDLFSFFNAHDSQVWSFDGVGKFLHIPFIALELFD